MICEVELPLPELLATLALLPIVLISAFFVINQYGLSDGIA
ncbi:putative membrane protein [Candidatus Erwinia dacicola]|uniref:Membrane protein n=1 Tax=Candidatus Erwinia dacicola TaxID=252393 RepID=A0A328TMJ6_9GAMM|nr:putative membrane protein [Candidatus Erwinia dacicola]